MIVFIYFRGQIQYTSIYSYQNRVFRYGLFCLIVNFFDILLYYKHGIYLHVLFSTRYEHLFPFPFGWIKIVLLLSCVALAPQVLLHGDHFDHLDITQSKFLGEWLLWSMSFSNGHRILHFRCFVSFPGQGLPPFVGYTLKQKLIKVIGCTGFQLLLQIVNFLLKKLYYNILRAKFGTKTRIMVHIVCVQLCTKKLVIHERFSLYTQKYIYFPPAMINYKPFAL